jgi:hypothetical protein
MGEEQMEQMRELLYNAIRQQLQTPFQPQGYYGGAKKAFNSKGSVATGTLINSLSVEWVSEPEQGDMMLQVSFPGVEPEFLPQIIDEGRKPSFKYPPLREIENWVRVKPVFFRDSRGKFTQGTIKQRSFLIARSIKEKGFKGRQFLSKAEDQVINQLTELGEEAMANYFQGLIEEGLVNLIQ